MECLSQRYVIADSRLHEAYRRLIVDMDLEQVEHLRRTQRLWLEFRDTVCEQEYEDASSGREASIERLACLERETRLRTRLLSTERLPLKGAEPVLDALRIEADANHRAAEY